LKHSKRATIICGSPGSGKSTYAKALASAQRAVLLDIDTCSERLVVAGLSLAGEDPMDRDSPSFKEHFREAIYETLFDVAIENLSHCDVVIVGPFTRELRLTDWPDVLRKRLECRVNVVYVYCEPRERKARLRARANPRDTGKFLDYEATNAYYGDESRPVFEHAFMDTSQHRALV
jgi:predicted kinase